MALRGSLSDFGLVEVLQLLAQGRKTGVLEVEERAMTTRLWLAHGELVRVARRNEAADESVLRALIAAELLSEEQLAAARAHPAAAGELAIETLVRAGTLEAAAAEQLAQLTSRETVLSLLLSEDGGYTFEPFDQPPVALHAPLRIEPLMLVALEELDAFRALRRRIPSPRRIYRPEGSLETYLAMNSAVDTELHKRRALYDSPALDADDAEPAVREGAGAGRAVGHIERLVFSLLDGERDVAQIIGRVRQGELPVLRALAWLEDHKLAVLVQAGAQGADFGVVHARAGRAALGQQLGAFAQAACWLVAAAALMGVGQLGHDAARLGISGQAPQILAWRGSRAEVMRAGSLSWAAASPHTDPWRHSPRVCHEALGLLPARPLD